ncbi:hypothetical protein LAWI1_G002547 [Lachnellula willkommii]|uniref:Developmental regulator protein n=1 Tax=Lachnellula willkommii TaxID=215461 RepID=A0A559MIF8_9HELO|nr:hypothetical protein LAWI1_G002547 [Lachnellula willkommii]
MPTYLVHGFRWQRAMIRIHIILNNLDDAAAEWIMAPATSATFLNSFYTLYDFLPPSNPPLPAPHTEVQVPVGDNVGGRRTLTKRNSSSRSSLNSLLRNGNGNGNGGRRGSLKRPATAGGTNGMVNGNGNGNGNGAPSLGRSVGSSEGSASTMQVPMPMQRIEEKQKKPSFNDWSAVKLLEQYDPDDMYAVSQPYAYVGDYMMKVSLGVSLTEEMAKYEVRVKGEEEELSSASAGTLGDGMSAREFRRKSRRLGWLEKLRDGLQKDADIGWFVVVVGDEERASPDDWIRGSVSTGSGEEAYIQSPPRSTKLRGLFGRRKTIPEE